MNKDTTAIASNFNKIVLLLAIGRLAGRARLKAVEDRSSGKKTDMGFLIRFAFWFSLVLLALPFDVGPDEEGRENVNPIQALLAAKDAVGDIAGLCERQPEVCETGASAIHTVTERAKLAARMAVSMIEENPSQKTTESKEPVTTGSISHTN